MTLSAERGLSCREESSGSLQQDSQIFLHFSLEPADAENRARPQRIRKGRRRQRPTAFGSISMQGASDICDHGEIYAFYAVLPLMCLHEPIWKLLIIECDE